MCTIILKDQEPILAEEDVIVYKSCYLNENNTVESIYTHFVYEKDVIYKSDFTFCLASSQDDILIASDGIEGEYRDSCDIYNIKAVVEGFHSLIKFDKERLTWYLTCLFIIPKGSLYYINPVGNVVSNRIMFKEIN